MASSTAPLCFWTEEVSTFECRLESERHSAVPWSIGCPSSFHRSALGHGGASSHHQPAVQDINPASLTLPNRVWALSTNAQSTRHAAIFTSCVPARSGRGADHLDSTYSCLFLAVPEQNCPSPSVSIHPQGQAAFQPRARLRLPRQPLRSPSHHCCHGHSNIEIAAIRRSVVFETGRDGQSPFTQTVQKRTSALTMLSITGSPTCTSG